MENKGDRERKIDDGREPKRLNEVRGCHIRGVAWVWCGAGAKGSHGSSGQRGHDGRGRGLAAASPGEASYRSGVCGVPV